MLMPPRRMRTLPVWNNEASKKLTWRLRPLEASNQILLKVWTLMSVPLPSIRPLWEDGIQMRPTTFDCFLLIRTSGHEVALIISLLYMINKCNQYRPEEGRVRKNWDIWPIYFSHYVFTCWLHQWSAQSAGYSLERGHGRPGRFIM